MKTIEPIKEAPFTADSFRVEDVAVAFLVHRITTLPKESLADLASLAPEFANCESSEELYEIFQTMKEILFPEVIGEYHEGGAGSARSTENLTKRMDYLGSQIREKRKKAGLTQTDLADKSGLPQSHISRLEAGQHSPSHKTLQKISEALGISVNQLDPAHE